VNQKSTPQLLDLKKFKIKAFVKNIKLKVM
jgi:hypothetical protein